jgi:steroid delta-isomerase-like uncharacterized protein
MSEQNNALVKRAVEEVWNQGNYAVLNELVSSNIVIHSPTPGGEIHGVEGIKHFYGALRDAFPDIHFTIDDQIAQGDRVVTRWTAQATHSGEYQGIPATGKQISIMGIDIDRIANGRVVECWPVMDELGLLQQLDVIPAPGQVSPNIKGNRHEYGRT